jgi:hypothetical protein
MKETAKPQNTIEPPEKTPFFKKEGESETSVMRSPVPFFTANGIQAKLTVGQPGDRFEQQANRVADRVVNGRPAVINRKSDGNDAQLLEEGGVHMQEEEELQMQEEEEELQMQEEEEELQMQEEEEELQMHEEEEELQMKEDEEELQMQEEEEELQMKEEEEELQMKSVNGKPRMSDGLSNQIQSAVGKGSSLPASTQSEMSDSIGYDFSDVKIHTGPESVQLNKELGAQAFTHGNDVFFNAGKFNPESTNGKHLLAHELTHVVQQGKGRVAPQVQGIFGKLKKGFKKVGKAIKGGAKKVFGGIKKGVKAIGKGAKWLGGKIGKGAKWLFGKIKKGATKVGKGIKKVAGKIWKGLKKAGKWVWNGLKYVGRQLWDKIKAIYHRAIRWITSLPARLKRLVVHLWNGVKSLKPWSLEWWKSLGKAETWKNFGLWLGELAIYALEVGGIGEIYETIADFIKFNTRAMTDDEIKLAKTVFGNSINYNLIRIDEYAVLGPSFSGREYVSFHTINGWGKIEPATLIHELTHIWQYEKMGAMYMPRALHGNSKPGFYDYGGVQALIDNAGKGMDAFNPEQQGDIMEDYYRILNNMPTKHGSATKADLIDYEVYVNEVKSK